MSACPQGHPNADDSRFCEQCGLQIAPPTGTSGPSLTSALPGTTAPAARKRRSWVIPVVILALLLVVGAGYLVFRKAVPSTTTVRISVTVYGESDCSAFGMGLGYGDVPGSLMTVRADGATVGVGILEDYGEATYLGCVFEASVPDVPMDASIYSLETGRRGEISNTRAEMLANGWSFDASLGN